MSFLSLAPHVNKLISPRDRLFSGYSGASYFEGALVQLDKLDEITRRHARKGLRDCTSIADFACHFGRLARAFRVGVPNASIYAYDIDEEASAFCARELGCIPVKTDWAPEKTIPPARHDLIVCASLLTHTRRAFLPRVLDLWDRMLAPGGLLCATFLGKAYLRDWKRGEMPHYCPAGAQPTEVDVARVARDFSAQRHAFYGYETSYSAGEPEYGVGFLDESIMQDEIEARPSLRLCRTLKGSDSGFGQDLAIILKRS